MKPPFAYAGGKMRLADRQQVTFRSKTQNRHATEVVWLNPAAAERAPQATLEVAR